MSLNENEEPCNVDDPSIDKDGFLFGMDPPLVAATRVSDLRAQPDTSLVIQAMAIPSNNEDMMHVATFLEDSDATIAVSVATPSLSSQIPSALRPQQDLTSTRIEAVEIDELALSRERSSESTEPQDDGDKDIKFCSRHWKVAILILFCLFVGGATGMILAINTRTNAAGDAEKSLAVRPSLRPSLAPTIAPTTSFAPSFSPSCVGDYSLIWVYETLGEHEYDHFHVSPNGMSALMTYTLEGFSGEEASFLETMDFSEYGVLVSTTRIPKLEISDGDLTVDGSRLILGVSKDMYEGQELGGALWVYQRVEMTTWIPMHHHFTGGGSQGAVFSVATSDTGKIYAIVAGSFSNMIPTYVQVYSSSNGDDDDGVKPIGNRLVEDTFSNTTSVGLSGNGLRLFVYTDDGVIRILDYDDDAAVWHPSGQSLNISSDGGARTLEVAESGKAFALLSSEAGSNSYMFHWNQSAWVTTVASGPQQGNAMLQYGAFSSDGRILVVVSGGNAVDGGKVHVYEQVNGDWIVAHVLELSTAFRKLLGVSVDAGGDRIVVAGTQGLHGYDRLCTNTEVPSPAPSSYLDGTRGTVFPTALIYESSPSFTGDFNGNGAGIAGKPSGPSSICGFNATLLRNLTQPTTLTSDMTPWSDSFGSSNNATAGGASDHNATEIQSFSTGTLVSADGSIMVVIGYDGATRDYVIDTYYLRNSSVSPGRLFVPYPITSAAVSGQGERIVFGTSGASAVQPEAYVLVYRREDSDWVLESKEMVDRGETGGLVSVAITDDGGSVAYAASFGNETNFISVYRLQGGSFDIVGSILSDDWLDGFTTVRFVDERLFVASSDGFIRTYDLLNNTWTRIGQRVSHFYEAMFVPAKNNTVLAIASTYFGVIVYDLKGDYWIPAMENPLSAQYTNISLATVDFSISSDGSEMLSTKLVGKPEAGFRTEPLYVSTLFKRVNDHFALTQEIVLNTTTAEGYFGLAQLTSSGDIVVAIDTEVTEYRLVSC